MMGKYFKYSLFLFFLAGVMTKSFCQEYKNNVLFIVIDDLRPELGCYGSKIIKSPNIDSLASKAVVFKNQFVTVPTCGPSRASLLTGMLPKKPGDLSNAIFELSGKKQMRPESFVENLHRSGYYTVGIGKISHSPDGHIYDYLQPKGNDLELPNSWDEMLFDHGKWGSGWNAFFGYSDGSNRNDLQKKVKPYENADVNDEGYPDGLTANMAMEKLRELAKKEQPFFLGVGFFKPHLPFNAPKKYWDMYDRSKIPLTPSPDIPKHVNLVSLHGSGEFNQYRLGDEKASIADPVSDHYARKLRHGYYASVSYIDAQIGKIFTTLEELGLDKNTIIVVWGDHGWHLGDDRVWGKHTIFDWALRSPLIIKTPGLQNAASCDKIISSVDIYPTLMELCGIKMPHKTDGSSFAPLLNDPANDDWKNSAYSYFRKGISVRTDIYRLTKYFRQEEPVIELYDHRNDPYENRNIAEDYPDIVKELMPLLEKGNTGLYEKL